MTVTNCICMKYGTRYGAEYPNRLYAGLRRHTAADLRLICLTDDPAGLRPEIEVLPLVEEPFWPTMIAAMRRMGLGSPFRKVSMYRPGLVADLDGPLILLDIDVVIVGSIDVLRDHAPGKVCMRMDWAAGPGSGEFGHGSVEKFEPDRHGYIYETMARDPVAALGYGREQIFTSRTADAAGDFVPFPDAWIASYKRDCRPPRPLDLVLPPRLPPDARVVSFHGDPKMSEAIAQNRSGPLAFARRAAWLADAWRD